MIKKLIYILSGQRSTDRLISKALAEYDRYVSGRIIKAGFLRMFKESCAPMSMLVRFRNGRWQEEKKRVKDDLLDKSKKS